MLRSLLHPPQKEIVWRELHWPHELQAETALALLRQLATDQFLPLIALEVEAHRGLIFHRLGVPAPAVRRVEQLVTSLLPDTAMTSTPPRETFDKSFRVALSNHARPLRSDAPEEIARAVLSGLTAVQSNERIVAQWLLGRTHAPRPVHATERSAAEPWWRPLVNGDRVMDAEQRRALAEKRRDHVFACLGRVAIEASTDGRARALAVGVLAGLRVAEAPGVGLRLIKDAPQRFNDVSTPWQWPLRMNVAELLGLLAWPLGEESLPGIPRDASRWLRADARVKPYGRVIAESTAPGEHRELGLSAEDARHHLHVIGPTGTGKSTVLANLILQDITAGRGVVVIEPKGDLVDDVLARIPPERVDDVVVLDPLDGEQPVGLNPLLSRGRSPELVADQMLAVFHGLYQQNWGPRLQDILHASLLTLAARGDASLCVLPALLTNPNVRKRLRAGIDDPIALEPFWAWFEAISDAERQQAIAPVLNKLRPFLLRKSVRAIVGQLEPRFRIDQVFSERKIVLVSLAKGLIGPEAAALLGSLFIAELWQATLGRGRVAPERRHPVMVYADEFQDYVHLPTDMADALAQARGLGVGLTLAHQHLAQLPTHLKSAVLANARSKVSFQLPADDAQVMARFAGGKLKADDFQRLARHEVYMQLLADGEITDFASGRTLPLPAASSDPELIRQASRNRYGRPVVEVEAEIRRMLEAKPEADVPLGRRGRGL